VISGLTEEAKWSGIVCFFFLLSRACTDKQKKLASAVAVLQSFSRKNKIAIPDDLRNQTKPWTHENWSTAACEQRRLIGTYGVARISRSFVGKGRRSGASKAKQTNKQIRGRR
jgi:hypothetical protein